MIMKLSVAPIVCVGGRVWSWFSDVVFALFSLAIISLRSECFNYISCCPVGDCLCDL